MTDIQKIIADLATFRNEADLRLSHDIVLDGVIADLSNLRDHITNLEAVVAQSAKTCGQGNCNCVGAKRVKDLVGKCEGFQSKDQRSGR